MKIVLNIEKKHLIFFGLFLVFIGSIFVIANGGQYNENKTPLSGVGHPDLYADYISSWTKDKAIIINDPQGISFGIGDNSDLYSIRALSNRIVYGDESTKNIFKGGICSNEETNTNNCISVEELVEKVKGINNNGEEQENNGNGETFEGEAIKILDKTVYGRDIDAKAFCKSNQHSGEIQDKQTRECSGSRRISAVYWSNSDNVNTGNWVLKLECDPRYDILDKVTCL